MPPCLACLGRQPAEQLLPEGLHGKVPGQQDAFHSAIPEGTDAVVGERQGQRRGARRPLLHRQRLCRLLPPCRCDSLVTQALRCQRLLLGKGGHSWLLHRGFLLHLWLLLHHHCRLQRLALSQQLQQLRQRHAIFWRS
jgi:hypothetical protein